MESFEQVLLLCRLQKAVRRMNHSIPADTQVEAINSTQARQKSTRQMTIADDIKLIVTQDRQGTPAYNTGLAKVAVQCSADTFAVNQGLILRIDICNENRHLRQALNRYASCFKRNHSLETA